MKIKDITGQQLYNEITDNSTISVSDDGRLFNAFEKDEIKIAFIGGSVTYGYNGCDSVMADNYVTFTQTELENKYPEKKITIKNYGISGTNCLIGLCIADMFVKDFSPDIVVVEYSINEEMTPQSAARTEGLVRKLLNLKSNPAVILLSVFCKDGYTCESYMKEIALHYHLCMTGMLEGVYALFKSQQLDWSLYSNDDGHPTKEGHRLISDCLLKSIYNSLSCDVKKENETPSYLFSDEYDDIKLIQANQLETDFKVSDEKLFCFEKALCNSTEGNHSLKFSVNCNKVFIVFVQDNNDDYACMQVKIDGKTADSIQGYSIFGWHNPVARMLLDTHSKKQHTIEIKPDKSDNQKQFRILCIMAG